MTSHKKSGRGRARQTITTSLKAFETLMTIEHKGFRDMILECRRMLSGTSEIATVEVIFIDKLPPIISTRLVSIAV